MEAVFLKLVNMSVTAGWLVVAIVGLRLIFRRAPKAMWVVLWGMVALRLICPISIESGLSLVPDPEPIPQAAADSILPADIPDIPILPESLVPHAEYSANPIQVWLYVLARIWLAGVAIMGLYMAFSYVRLRRRLREAVPWEDGVWTCDQIQTPFILGVLRPRIYLPTDVSKEDVPYILAHEHAHLRRRDHWWKPLGFLLLAVYWFNPALWLAYVLLCRDIELACDEKVMKTLGKGCKKPYSLALIRCSVSRRTIAACPLAFGEVGVKERVKTVLSYKKPGFWVIVMAIVLCLILGICFLSNPKAPEPPGLEEVFSFQDIRDVDTIVLTNLHNGVKTELTEPVEEILGYLEYCKGRFPESGKGWSEGSYELCFQGEGEPLSVAFGDSAAIYTGEYGDGYPARYQLYGHSIEDIIHFLSRYDSSEATVQDILLEESADLELSIEVRSPHTLYAVVTGEAGWSIDSFFLEQQTDSGWTEFSSDSGFSSESVEGAVDAAAMGWMDDLPMGHYRVIVNLWSGQQEERKTCMLQQEFDIIGQTEVPGMVPLEYLPQPLSLSDPETMSCLVVGGTTVLRNQVIWDAFLADSGAYPIRIVLADTGDEAGVASQVMDVVFADGQYHVYELKDGIKTETLYRYLHRVDLETTDGGSGYGYLLTNDAQAPRSLEDEGQLLYRTMLTP